MVVIHDTTFEVRRDGPQRTLRVQGEIMGVDVTLTSIAELVELIQDLSREHAWWTAESTPWRDPYGVLGIPRNATLKLIKSAYRQRARQCHPDRKGGSDQQMQAVNRAYETIMAGYHASHKGDSNHERNR